jgi:dTDP-3-amino-3,4,6-trideoxy-alpha-D-glucose transaminase
VFSREVTREATRAQRESIGLLDLSEVNGPLKAELLAALSDLIDSGAFSNGPEVAAFERAFATYCGARHCVGLASGLDALRLGLLAHGIGPGDEVVVPAMTFAATFEAIVQSGGTPVPVDVSDGDYCLDPDALDAAVGPRTRAIMPVHLYGQLADMAGIAELARARGLTVLEDACQAHGAERDGSRAGGGGFTAGFSFYPSKNLGAIGDAGALLTDDEDVAAVVRMLREHGEARRYQHERIGYTSRLDTVQAAVLLRKLPHLDEWNAERRRVAARYDEALDGVGDLRLPPVAVGSVPVWYLYVVRTGSRDALAGFLAERRIGTGRHYPTPPHLSSAYAFLGKARGAFPVAEALADEALSLPIYPGLSDEQIERVVESIREFFSDG